MSAVPVGLAGLAGVIATRVPGFSWWGQGSGCVVASVGGQDW